MLGLMLFSGIAEVVSLGALLPFLAALSSPEQVLAQPKLAPILEWLDIVSSEQILFPMTLLFVAAAVSAAGIRLLLLWSSTRLSFAAGADLGIEVYRRTLYQPYSVHIARNSSDIIAGITGKVAGLVYGGLLPAVAVASSVVLIVAVMSALLAIDPLVATLSAVTVGVAYGLITRWTRRRLEQNSQRIATDQTLVVKALQEGLGGIRDVLLDGMQEFYCRLYVNADRPLRSAQGNNQFIAAAPRYLIEAIAMILIAIMAYGLTRSEHGLSVALPILGALALGAQKMLQAVQTGYAAWVGMAGSRASLADAIHLLDQPMPENDTIQEAVPMIFRREVCLSKVEFRYGPDEPSILQDLDLTIPYGARIGVVGTTGSGKSTLLDILMGLLVPNAGLILVDGVAIDESNLRAWQRLIAHVPQHIYLADSTIAENIAFGVPLHDVDMERVRAAAIQAHIANFIESSPGGYEARVGERGIRLSGGQRQRIGIARALYKQASILIFDEATSALDTVTEAAVMDAIAGLDREMTILLIAHRLSTVRHCDMIVELDHGRIVASGTYEQLLATSESFRRLVAAAP